jgi:hypothetical protein
MHRLFRSGLRAQLFTAGWIASAVCNQTSRGGQACRRVIECSFNHSAPLRAHDRHLFFPFSHIRFTSRFAEATTSCLIKKETEGSGHVISSPIKLHAAADSCGSVSPPFAAGDSKSEEANSLPGVTCTSFANLPNRLRRHFLHMMHKSVKAKFGLVSRDTMCKAVSYVHNSHCRRHKSWAGMSREEKAELQQMSEDVLKYPTNVRYMFSAAS